MSPPPHTRVVCYLVQVPLTQTWHTVSHIKNKGPKNKDIRPSVHNWEVVWNVPKRRITPK